MADEPRRPGDRVSDVLVRHGVTSTEIERVRGVLWELFAARPPDEPQYLVAQHRGMPEEGVLTAGEMVQHLERLTPLGRSYVELFIAGGLTNPHVSLKEALARLGRPR